MPVVSLKVSEIDLGKKLGFERFEAKLWPIQLVKNLVHNPVGDSKFAFERYVSSPFVFLLLL